MTQRTTSFEGTQPGGMTAFVSDFGSLKPPMTGPLGSLHGGERLGRGNAQATWRIESTMSEM